VLFLQKKEEYFANRQHSVPTQGMDEPDMDRDFHTGLQYDRVNIDRRISFHFEHTFHPYSTVEMHTVIHARRDHHRSVIRRIDTMPWSYLPESYNDHHVDRDTSVHIVLHIDSVDIYMSVLLFSMRRIWLLVSDMYPNDIDKQTNHFQKMKYNYHAHKHPENDMDQLKEEMTSIELHGAV
jgi:hypothetical protein